MFGKTNSVRSKSWLNGLVGQTLVAQKSTVWFYPEDDGSIEKNDDGATGTTLWTLLRRFEACMELGRAATVRGVTVSLAA